MIRRLKNLGHLLLAILASIAYSFPARRLTVLAITGTDGKTTTSTLLYHLLKEAGYKVALVSTVAAYIGDERIDTGFHVTSPSSFALQRLLSRVLQAGCDHVVLEVTSHGIDQQRIWGIHPLYAGITNVTHEHLDYHKTYERYLATKAKLLVGTKMAFINAQADLSFPHIQKILEAANQPYTSYSIATMPPAIRQAAHARFGTQEYNVQNAALAASIAGQLGIENKTIAAALRNFPPIPGRMEEIKNRHGITVIVDFAHTPHALEEALLAVCHKRGKGSGRVIVVFGCAGLRDRGKRPLMGEIASRLADYVILTAEDPRTEHVYAIINQIKSGVTQHHKVMTQLDRKEAIRFALRDLAKRGDFVIICGKGHERSMCYGTTEYPWSDQDAVREVLA